MTIPSVFTRQNVFKVILVVLISILWVFLRYIYRDRLGAFGCFDDCFNYMGGYFLLSGKRLYSEIFFNHQPLMAYMSAAIQFITKPESIYMLVYEHRMFLVYFALAFDIVLIVRFGLVGFLFSFLYESTKGYVFGERFLAEAMVVYPLVYLWILVWQIREHKSVTRFDLILSSIFTWFVVFAREPFIPLVLFLYGILLYRYRLKERLWSLLILGILSITTLFIHSIPDYVYNVITVNQLTIATGEITMTKLTGTGLFQVFFYPLFIFFGGVWNHFRIIEVGLAVMFLMSLAIAFIHEKNYRKILLLFIVLGLANIRTINPGLIYYAAFHLTIWYALFITTVLLLIGDQWTRRAQGIALVFYLLFGILIGFGLLNRQSYLYDKVDRQVEFNNGYGNYYALGSVIQILSHPGDTLFLDGADDLIYWQAKLYSPFLYSWYTSVMPAIAYYRDVRDEMFATKPPDFYYNQCSKKHLEPEILPKNNKTVYRQLLFDNTPSCLFIKSDKIPNVTQEQWEGIKKFSFSL